MKNKFLFVLLLLISISIVSFCSTFFYVKYNKTEVARDDILVMTSCNPIYIATSNVVGDIDGVTVENLSQPTTGCLHDYTLTTEDMKNLAACDVLVVNGGGMEGYLDDVIAAYPNLAIIDTFEAVEDTYPIIKEEDEWCYQDKYGRSVLGWLKLGKKWYYMDGEFGFCLMNTSKKMISWSAGHTAEGIR